MKRLLVPFVSLALALVLGGCFEDDVVRPVQRVPSPDSPTGVVRLFAWCWNHRDPTRYEKLFTSDFVFVFAAGDSAGNLYRDDPFDRSDMLLCARHLFVGDGGSASPARSISFVLEDTLHAVADSRPGLDPLRHREIPSAMHLTIVTQDGGTYEVTGNVTFHVVRGDSAQIPAGLGLAPDSTRWYVDRIEDGTLGSTLARTAAPQPTGQTTWGRILRLYL